MLKVQKEKKEERKKKKEGVPSVAQWLTNLTSIHEDSRVQSLDSPVVKDPSLLWLWCRLKMQLRFGVAVAVV